MSQTAAHLMDHVIPHVPMRQWVLSLPIPLRVLLAAQPELVTLVLQVMQRVVTRHLLHHAGLKASYRGRANSGRNVGCRPNRGAATVQTPIPSPPDQHRPPAHQGVTWAAGRPKRPRGQEAKRPFEIPRRDANSDVARFAAEPSVHGSDPVVSYMARLPREAADGTKWVCKTGETNLVGSLVRAATGRTLSDYLADKL